MAECGCIYVGIDRYTTEYTSGIVTARVLHTCSECGGEIRQGTRYEAYIGDDDGWLFSHATCLDCLSIRDEFFCDGFVWGHVFENVAEHVDNMGGEIDSSCLLRLTEGARTVVLEMIDECFEMINEDDDDDDEEDDEEVSRG